MAVMVLAGIAVSTPAFAAGCRGYCGTDNTSRVGQQGKAYVVGMTYPELANPNAVVSVKKATVGNTVIANMISRLKEGDRASFIEMVKRAGIRYE